MEAQRDREAMRERFFLALAEAAMPLKGGDDPEVSLEVLIEAVDRLREHLERELQELREEQAD